jgi:hypothetical protein
MSRSVATWKMLCRLVCGTIPLLLLVGCSGDDSCTCPENGQPPVIFPAVSVGSDSSGIFVDLEVDPRGLPTFCDCVYDTALPLHWVGGPVSVGESYGSLAVTVALPEAEFDREYLFRCRAYSEAGTTSTAVGTFLEASPNEVPMTTLSYSPDQADSTGFRFRLNWFGWDPDGWIDHFDIRTEVDFAQGEWVSVVSTDTVFILGPEVTVYWMFSVRAVDDRGAADPTPESVVLTPDDWEIVDARPARSRRGDRERSDRR